MCVHIALVFIRYNSLDSLSYTQLPRVVELVCRLLIGLYVFSVACVSFFIGLCGAIDKGHANLLDFEKDMTFHD